MKLRCNQCKKEYDLKDDFKYCPSCGSELEEFQEKLKKLAIIKGTISGDMDVVIHPDGYIEFLQFRGEHTISNKYEEKYSREITDEEYNKL